MMFVYGADLSAKNEYSNDDWNSSNDSWNQAKGIRDGHKLGFTKLILRVAKLIRKEELEEKAQKQLENEEKQQKQIQNEEKLKKELQKKKEQPEESDDETDFSSPIPTQTRTASVTKKFDIGFPSISDSLTMKVSTEEDGWKVVNSDNKRVKAVSPDSDKKKTDSIRKKTQMCISTKNGKRCPHGKSCRYAHTPDDLTPADCQHGKDCKFVRCVSGCYINTGGKKCLYSHPEEQIVDYLCRAGLKSRSAFLTVDEMDLAYKEYLENPVVEQKPVKKPTFKPWVWKPFRNIQNDAPKKVWGSTVKTVPVPENLEKLKIAKRAEINIKIKDAMLAIKRNSEKIARFKAMQNITEFYKKEIVKSEEVIKTKKVEIETLEEELKGVDSMKIEAKPVITESKPEVVNKSPEKKQEKKIATVVLYVSPKKVVAPVVVAPVVVAPVVVAPVVVTPVVVTPVVVTPVVENGWTLVKSKKPIIAKSTPIANDRDSAFDILKNSERINSTRTKTKMCFRGKSCRYRDCSYAHSEKELKVSNCLFGNNCKFVRRTRLGLENISKTQSCCHKHPDETMTEFYVRIGVRK